MDFAAAKQHVAHTRVHTHSSDVCVQCIPAPTTSHWKGMAPTSNALHAAWENCTPGNSLAVTCGHAGFNNSLTGHGRLLAGLAYMMSGQPASHPCTPPCRKAPKKTQQGSSALQNPHEINSCASLFHGTHPPPRPCYTGGRVCSHRAQNEVGSAKALGDNQPALPN